MAVENKDKQVVLRIDDSEDSTKAYGLLADTCSSFTTSTRSRHPTEYPVPNLAYGYIEDEMLTSGEVFIGFEAIAWWCRDYVLKTAGRSSQDTNLSPVLSP